MMMTATPWTLSEDDRKFHRTSITAIALALVISVGVSQVPLPEVQNIQQEIKPRLAEIILPEPEMPEPAEVPLPKPKPEPVAAVPVEPPKVEEPEPPVVVAEKKQTVQAAREKAKVSGLLAFQDQLQAMRTAVDKSNLNDTANLSRGTGEAATIDRSMITSQASDARRASVNVAALSSETGGVALSGRENTIVEAPVEAEQPSGAVRMTTQDLSGARSIEEVRRVFDANKGAIFSIYNRALRKDPTLLGKMVLELVIEPDGSVSSCEVLVSELGDDELLKRVKRRVELFDFGERDVAVTRISYPVHFLPT